MNVMNEYAVSTIAKKNKLQHVIHLESFHLSPNHIGFLFPRYEMDFRTFLEKQRDHSHIKEILLQYRSCINKVIFTETSSQTQREQLVALLDTFLIRETSKKAARSGMCGHMQQSYLKLICNLKHTELSTLRLKQSRWQLHMLFIRTLIQIWKCFLGERFLRATQEIWFRSMKSSIVCHLYILGDIKRHQTYDDTWLLSVCIYT